MFYERELKPIKIRIRDDEPFSSLLEIIKQQTGIASPKVIRRTFFKGNNVAEVI